MLDSALFVHKRGMVTHWSSPDLVACRIWVVERGTWGMSCGEKVNWQRSGWHREGVGGVVIGIKYKSTGTKVNWRCAGVGLGGAGIGRRGQGEAVFRGLKEGYFRSPRKLDWRPWDDASRDERRVAGLWWSAGEGVGLAVAWTGRGGWLAGRREGQRHLLHGVASHFPCIALPGVRAETRYSAPVASSTGPRLRHLRTASCGA